MYPFASYRTLAILSDLLLFLRVTGAVTCYLPNGKIAPDDRPCRPQNPVSACCGGSEYVCSTNNMCQHINGGYFVIGSCTDQSWNSPACPGYCFFRDHIHNSVFRCGQDTYCCADGPKCNCTTNTNTQPIRDFLPDYSVLVGSSVSIATTVITSSLATPPGATPPASTTSSSTQSSGTSTSESSSLTTSSSITTSSVSASPVAQTSSHGSSEAVKIGVGVGVSLGVVVLVLGFLLLRQQMRKRKGAHMLYNNPADPAYPSSTHQLYDMPKSGPQGGMEFSRHPSYRQPVEAPNPEPHELPSQNNA